MRTWTWIVIRVLVQFRRVAPHTNERVIAVLQRRVVRWELRVHFAGQLEFSFALGNIEEGGQPLDL